LFPEDFPGSLVMLNALLSAYPNHGLIFYKTLDYWECKDLLEIANSSKTNPPDRLQARKNDVFNHFLDTHANIKFEWSFVDSKYNLWDIKIQTEFMSE
jgi:hypothetical protein